jgi:hypothetical protein
MSTPSDAGKRIEVHFTDHDRAIEVELNGEPADALGEEELADRVVTAVGMDDPDDAVRHLEANVRNAGTIRKLP